MPLWLHRLFAPNPRIFEGEKAWKARAERLEERVKLLEQENFALRHPLRAKIRPPKVRG